MKEESLLKIRCTSLVMTTEILHEYLHLKWNNIPLISWEQLMRYLTRKFLVLELMMWYRKYIDLLPALLVFWKLIEKKKSHIVQTAIENPEEHSEICSLDAKFFEKISEKKNSQILTVDWDSTQPAHQSTNHQIKLTKQLN